MEAAFVKKRNQEIEEYRKEKRRNIPTWPQSLGYKKFKHDLVSWDKEYRLSSGSFKFCLLAKIFNSKDNLRADPDKTWKKQE